MRFHGNVDDSGKLTFTGSTEWVRSRIKELRGMEVLVEISRYKKHRSLNQNKYYWAVVVDTVYNGLRDAGFDDVRNEEDAHNVLKELFFKKLIHSDQHDNLMMVMSTTQYSTVEFEEKLDMIRRWALEYLNIIIPLPNEQLKMEM